MGIRLESYVRMLLEGSLSFGVSRSSSRTICNIHAGSEMLRTSVGGNLREWSIRVDLKPQDSASSLNGQRGIPDVYIGDIR